MTIQQYLEEFIKSLSVLDQVKVSITEDLGIKDGLQEKEIDSIVRKRAKDQYLATTFILGDVRLAASCNLVHMFGPSSQTNWKFQRRVLFNEFNKWKTHLSCWTELPMPQDVVFARGQQHSMKDCSLPTCMVLR
jgi:hypothetical protein